METALEKLKAVALFLWGNKGIILAFAIGTVIGGLLW